MLVTAILLGAFGPANAEADATQRRLNLTAGRIARLQDAYEVGVRRAAGMRKAVAAADAQLRSARKGMIALTQGLYMGSVGTGASLLESGSVTELGEKMTFIEHLRAADRDTLQRVSVLRLNLLRKQKQLAAVIAKQKTVLSSLGREQRALAKMFRQQQERLRALERSRRSRARASRFDPPLVGGSGPFVVCPVDRPRAYSNDFGAPRGDRRHEGNDILAPRGTPIRAPFDGTFKGNRSGRGGLQARVFGARGYVFNAHLDSFAGVGNGSKVAAGTVIGYVGDSGNAKGGPTHDHFEWHPGGGGAVNPFRYLNLVCR